MYGSCMKYIKAADGECKHGTTCVVNNWVELLNSYQIYRTFVYS